MMNLKGRNQVINQEKMIELKVNVIRKQYGYQTNKDRIEELMDYI